MSSKYENLKGHVFGHDRWKCNFCLSVLNYTTQKSHAFENNEALIRLDFKLAGQYDNCCLSSFISKNFNKRTVMDSKKKQIDRLLNR